MRRLAGARLVVAAIIAAAGWAQGRTGSGGAPPPPPPVRGDSALAVVRALGAEQGGMSAFPIGPAGPRPRFGEGDLARATAFIRRECAPLGVDYQLAAWTSEAPLPGGRDPVDLPVWVVTCPALRLETTAGERVVPTTWIYDAQGGALLGIFSFRAPAGGG